jgi:fructose-1-phosphate kinase PfkB-like protein
MLPEKSCDRPLPEIPRWPKRNLQEWESAIGVGGANVSELARSLRQRRDLPEHFIVTLGEAGALLVAGSDAWFARPPRISRINPIGAGDSFAAGYLKAAMDGKPPAAALALAVAAAASDAATPEPGTILPSEIPALLSRTEVSLLRFKRTLKAGGHFS